MKGNIMTNVEIQALESLFPAPTGQNALAYWIPIAMREKVLAMYRDAGISVRARYRGPRAVSIGREMTRNDKTTYLRTRHRAMQDCLLADATHFSVYVRN
jgi:hypothetical protein